MMIRDLIPVGKSSLFPRRKRTHLPSCAATYGLDHLNRSTCRTARLWRVGYFTGAIKCWYGVPAHMTYGTFVSGSAAFGY